MGLLSSFGTMAPICIEWLNAPAAPRITTFGSNSHGKFMCEHAADAEGDRATRNGQ
jgi:hypothetical protein